MDLIGFALTLLGGLSVFALGYLFTLFFGGKASLGIVDFTSQINRSKHAIEIKTEAEQQTCTWKDYTP